jgi:hypothetical protein
MSLRGVVATALVVAAAFAASQAGETRNATADRQYVAALQSTMRAIDLGTMTARYEACWATYAKKKGAENAVSAALATMGMAFICDNRLGSAPKGGIRIDQARKVLLEAVVEERNSAWPILLYAWFVNLYREPGMRAPVVEDQGTRDVTVDGKTQKAHFDKVIDDPAKKERVLELLKKAEARDPKNLLLLYLKAAFEKNRGVKKQFLWKCIAKPGTQLWEFGALSMLRSMAKADPEEMARVVERAKAAKAVVGDSPRAKGHGFGGQ